MKSLLVLFAATFILSGCGMGSVAEPASNESENNTEIVGVQEGGVSIVIDDGVSATTVDIELIEGMTAYDALKLATDDQGVELEVTEYDFGVLVDAISGMTNTEEKAWIYFVNGNSGNVGADQYELTPGDVLEWKYTEPIF